VKYIDTFAQTKKHYMEHIEKIVYEIIGKTSKLKLSKELGITRNTLDSRLKKGGWLKTEIEIIVKLYND